MLEAKLSYASPVAPMLVLLISPSKIVGQKHHLGI